MLIPPDSMPGWKVFTVGDDIAWLHPGADGRLWAINPEAGYFGVVPGTNPETNRNAYEMIRRDTLFTNVALTADNQPWWEGLSSGKPVLDWQGRPYDPAQRSGRAPELALHGLRAAQSRAIRRTPRMPRGVPISAHRLRRPPPRGCAAGLRGARLAARRAGRRLGGLRDHRGGGRARSAWCAATRWRCSRSAATTSATTGSTGSNVGAKLTHAAAHLPRQLVPPRRAGQVPVAGLRREPARARVDAGALRRQGRRQLRRRSAGCRGRQDLDMRGAVTSAPEALQALLTWTRRCGARKWRRSAQYLGKYGDRLPRDAAGGAELTRSSGSG